MTGRPAAPWPGSVGAFPLARLGESKCLDVQGRQVIFCFRFLFFWLFIASVLYAVCHRSQKQSQCIGCRRWADWTMSKSNPFEEAIRGVRTAVTKAIDVTDLLLGDLLDKRVITQGQYDGILVRCFTMSIVYCWSTLFVCITSAYVSW